MKTRRANPNRVKLHRSYTVEEIAELFGCHKNTVWTWTREEGLPVIAGSKHRMLVLGSELKAFLQKRRNKNKQPCKPDELYCLKCRAPRKPEAGLVDYQPKTEKIGNLLAICPICQTYMNKRISVAKLPAICEKLGITLTLAQRRIGESEYPSVNSDFERPSKP
jgi:hypothetical protein